MTFSKTTMLVAAIAAVLAVSAGAAAYAVHSTYGAYTTYAESPHIHIENGDLTTYGLDPFDNVKYNYSYQIHAKTAPGECIDRIEWSQSYDESGYWLDITPFRTQKQIENGQCITEIGKGGSFGFGYGGGLPPGTYQHLIRVYDQSGGVAGVAATFTLE